MKAAPIEVLAQINALDDEQRQELDKPLDMSRVKQKPGGGHDYLPEHDVIRTANRIFGYGRWGTEVVELVPLGQHQVTNSKGQDGIYVGYRCTVRLTVAGCVPVCGVGYGDAFEKQWSAVVTAHELACKEAESDAIKRAFKKYGDQFGLVLYAKDGDRYAIMAEAEERSQWATEDEVRRYLAAARNMGDEMYAKAATSVTEHMAKYENRVNREWLTKCAEALARKAKESAQVKDANAEVALEPSFAEQAAARLAAAGIAVDESDFKPEAEQPTEGDVAEAFKDAA